MIAVLRPPEWLPFVPIGIGAVALTVALLALRITVANYRAAGHRVVIRTLYPTKAGEHGIRVTNAGRSGVDVREVVALWVTPFRRNKWSYSHAHPIPHLVEPPGSEKFRLEGYQSRDIFVQYGRPDDHWSELEHLAITVDMLRRRGWFGDTRLGIRLGDETIVLVPRLRQKQP